MTFPCRTVLQLAAGAAGGGMAWAQAYPTRPLTLARSVRRGRRFGPARAWWRSSSRGGESMTEPAHLVVFIEKRS